MIDREKTITHLKAYVNCYADRHKTCNQNCVLYGHGDCAKYVIESINDAIKLLKEQKPKNAIMEGTDVMHIRRCPSCKVILHPWCANYCYNCGQAVKLDE